MERPQWSGCQWEPPAGCCRAPTSQALAKGEKTEAGDGFRGFSCPFQHRCWCTYSTPTHRKPSRGSGSGVAVLLAHPDIPLWDVLPTGEVFGVLAVVSPNQSGARSPEPPGQHHPSCPGQVSSAASGPGWLLGHHCPAPLASIWLSTSFSHNIARASLPTATTPNFLVFFCTVPIATLLLVPVPPSRLIHPTFLIKIRLCLFIKYFFLRKVSS